MKNTTRSSLALACLLSTVAISPAHAEFKCDQRFLNRVDTLACAKAAEGADSLRRFVTRTQSIYGLQMSDYARFEDAEQVRIAKNVEPKPVAELVSNPL